MFYHVYAFRRERGGAPPVGRGPPPPRGSRTPTPPLSSGTVDKFLNKSDNNYYAVKEIETKDNKKEIIKEFENEVNILSI